MLFFKFILNKVLIIFILAIIIAGGVYLWKKNQNQNQNQPNPENNTLASVSPEPNYPRVDKFEVPILMYHYIRDASNESELGKGLSVSPQNFDRHLQWLKTNDYQTISMADLIAEDRNILSKVMYENKKPIILTFDDGYKDAYTEALPILKKHKFLATFYIIQEYIGKPSYMNQEEIDQLKNLGFEIGSHSLSHPDLTKVSLKEAERQISQSIVMGLTFCYPSGKYNETTVNLVQKAGYRTAVTTKFGIANEDSSILELPRVRVEDTSGEILGQKIEAAFK